MLKPIMPNPAKTHPARVNRSSTTMAYRVCALALLLACPGTTVWAQEPAAGSVYQRPTEVRIVMSTSRKKYDGEYQLSQRALICGELKADENFAGVPIFQLNFPDGGDFDINDVTFSSQSLVGGAKETTDFYLSINVKSASIGQPAAYVLDTRQAGNRGTAQLSVDAGAHTLKVEGVNDWGETTDLTVVCHTAAVRTD